MNERSKVRAGSNQQLPPKPPAKQSAADEATKQRNLEDSRRTLFERVSKFRSLLVDTTIPENKTATSREVESASALESTKAAWDLNFHNMDEGTMTLMSLMLHTALATRDDINRLKFQNAYLANKVEALKKEVAVLKQDVPPAPAADKTDDETK